MDSRHHHLAMNASRQHDATTPAHLSQRYPHPRDSYYPSQGIDVSAISASVQRYIPSNSPNSTTPLASNATASSSHMAATSYISLPPGIDPATVDFRTFYPYNPSEVKHRKRTTRNQLKLLEETFKRETKPNATLRKTLAAQLEMTPRGVQVWFQNRRAKEKSLAKKLSSGDKRSASTSVLSASASIGNGNEGNSTNGGASSQPTSVSCSASEATANDPDARNLLGEDGNFDQSDARMISGGNANVDLCDDDLDIDVVGDEECESSFMEDDDIFDAAVKREHGVAFGATPSPSSTTSDLAAASRISLPASANSSPPTSALKPLAPSPKDKSRSPLASNDQSPPIKHDEEHPEEHLPPAATNGNGGAIPQRTSWHGSSGQTPTMMSSALPSQDASNGTQFTDNHGGFADVRPPANNDLRRPSLPTHLNLTGLGLRNANGHHSGPPTSFRMPGNERNGTSNENLDTGNAVPSRPVKIAPSRIYDPTASRRLSLDRLASHPYAQLALQANNAVFGQQGLSMYRRASAFAGSGQNFNVGYGRGTRHGHGMNHGAQFATERYQHWQRRQMGSEFGTIGEVHTPQAGAVDLPIGNNFDLTERPQEDGQAQNMSAEFMHRGSLPGDAYVEPHQQFSAAQEPPQLFPREGHVYALPHRDYAPPTNGPLPAADFSFGTGTDGSPSGVAAATDGADDNSNNGGDAAAQGHNDIAASLAGYTFPQGSSTSASSTMRPPSNEDIAPLATTGPLGNPFGAPRFGSIASVASEISEYASSSETSVSTNASSGSGPPYMQPDPLSADAAPRRGSVFEYGTGYDLDGRRPSYTGQIADMLSHLDVHNGSNSSLSHEGAAQSSLSTSMHISQSSELAFALSHRKGSNVATSMNQPPTGSSGHSSDSDMDVSVNVSPECQPISDQDPMAFDSRQSFSNSSTNSSLMYPISISASSSTSSLNVSPHLGVSAAAQLARKRQLGGHMQHSSLGLQIPADGFICSDIEEVSGTGHYSPVSPPNSMGAANMYGIEFAQTGGPNGSGSNSMLNVQHSQHPLSQSSVPVYAQQQSHSQGNQGDTYMKMQDDSLGPQSMPYRTNHGHGSSTENPSLPPTYYR